MNLEIRGKTIPGGYGMDAEELKVHSEDAEWTDSAAGKRWAIQSNDHLTAYQS